MVECHVILELTFVDIKSDSKRILIPISKLQEQKGISLMI